MHNGDACAGFAVRSEEKGFRRTRDVWFILADINWRTTPQDALCPVAFMSKFHLGNLQFQLHFFARTRLCTHAHTCSLAHGPMDSRALVWAVRACAVRPKAPPDRKLEKKAVLAERITGWPGLVNRARPERVGSVGIGTGRTGSDRRSAGD